MPGSRALPCPGLGAGTAKRIIGAWGVSCQAVGLCLAPVRPRAPRSGSRNCVALRDLPARPRQLHHAIPLRVTHPVAEDCRALVSRDHALQQRREPLSTEDVVAARTRWTPNSGLLPALGQQRKLTQPTQGDEGRRIHHRLPGPRCTSTVSASRSTSHTSAIPSAVYSGTPSRRAARPRLLPPAPRSPPAAPAPLAPRPTRQTAPPGPCPPPPSAHRGALGIGLGVLRGREPLLHLLQHVLGQFQGTGGGGARPDAAPSPCQLGLAAASAAPAHARAAAYSTFPLSNACRMNGRSCISAISAGV